MVDTIGDLGWTAGFDSHSADRSKFNTIASSVDYYTGYGTAATGALLATMRQPAGAGRAWRVAGAITAAIGRLIKFEFERYRRDHWHQAGQKRVNEGAVRRTNASRKTCQLLAPDDIQYENCSPRADFGSSKAIQSFIR